MRQSFHGNNSSVFLVLPWVLPEQAHLSICDLWIWLNNNTMLHRTFLYFCLNEAKRLCLSHCSRLLDDVECAFVR